MLYAAKCYWPGATAADLHQIARRAAGAGLAPGSGTVSYLGSLLFAADDLVMCLFCGPARATVIQASNQLGVPCERLMDVRWLAQPPSPQGTRRCSHQENDTTPRDARRSCPDSWR